MEFRLLGTVEAAVDGRPVDLGRRRERGLLAVLLVDVGKPVSVSRLVELLWDDDPPRDPRKALHVAVSRLRRTLTAAAGDGLVRLVSHPAGYALHLDPESVDVHHFTALVEQARRRDDPAKRAGLLRDALALWRGPALADLPLDRLDEYVRAQLEEARLAALELRVEAELAAGRHEELVAELTGLTTQHPTRERLVAALLTALYRVGRQRDALDVYQRTAARLVEELGLDPGPALRELHTAILRDDPDLAAPPAVQPTPPQSPTPAPLASVPLAQLPADSTVFTGRDYELTELLAPRSADQQAVAITAIDGMAGVGKTSLAVHAAHRLAADYPDGQLFLDLHGHTDGVDPADPADALDRLLRSLGVPGDQIPIHTDDRAALYRSLLAEKRVLVLLDNAADEAQVHPLLPGGSGCLVLITSRKRLIGLDTSLLSLECLPPDDAATMLSRMAGADRVAGEPAELIAQVVELCGRLPLAIRVAAARLRHRPAWTLAHLAERLRDHRYRLAELEAGQRGVAAALDLSYRHLTDDQQRTFRLVCLHPGPDIDAHAAAALTDTAVEHAERLLDQLLDTHLLQQHRPGRYHLHDLIRAHAARTSAERGSQTERRSALVRLFDYYAHTATAAMDVAYPHEVDHRPRSSHPNAPAPVFDGQSHAAAWLDTELANLLATAAHAAQHGPPTHTVHLSATLHWHLRVRGWHASAATLHTDAIRVARGIDHRDGELAGFIGLGEVRWMLGQYEPAADCFEGASRLARDIGDHGSELRALYGLGRVHRMRGRHQAATDCYLEAMRISADIGDRGGELNALIGLGNLYRLQRQHAQATEFFERAVRLARRIGDHNGEVNGLHGLGRIHYLQGQYDLAADYFRQDLEIVRNIGNRTGELSALTSLGDIYCTQGRHRQAAEHYRRVLALAEEIGNRNYQFEALHGLGRVDHATGRAQQALAHQHNALGLAQDINQPEDQVRAHDGLARAHHTLGQDGQSRHHWQQVLKILAEIGLTEVEGINADDIRARLAALHQAKQFA